MVSPTLLNGDPSVPKVSVTASSTATRTTVLFRAIFAGFGVTVVTSLLHWTRIVLSAGPSAAVGTSPSGAGVFRRLQQLSVRAVPAAFLPAAPGFFARAFDGACFLVAGRFCASFAIP